MYRRPEGAFLRRFPKVPHVWLGPTVRNGFTVYATPASAALGATLRPGDSMLSFTERALFSTESVLLAVNFTDAMRLEEA